MASSEALKNWLAELKWNFVSGEEFAKLSDPDKLKRVRHSAAHLMAAALEELEPKTVFATGPATPQGYFYDVRCAQPVSLEMLEKIQNKMADAAAKKERFSWTSVPRAQAIEKFKSAGQDLKVEILQKIPSQEVTLYRNGVFVDLCAGPHVPHTGWLKHVKVLNFAAAHWKKDEKIPSLTRIFGTAWLTADELKGYLELVEELKTRDHRQLGPQLELFSFHPWAASALWHPGGLNLRTELQKLWRESIAKRKYVEIFNPILYRKELFETSGHWQHFKSDMFVIKDDDNEPSFVMKPMNCPDTMLFFKTRNRSYRELPLRVAEGQILHRNEVAGALHGLMRTRQMVQDDAHIFLTAEQVQSEILGLLEMVKEIYGVFGVNYKIGLSTRPKEFLGSQETWDQAEDSLKKALASAKIEYGLNPGDGAFYGPKIDLVIMDSLGRDWQCATLQLDFQQPERFDLTYVAEDGSHKRPIVIHRAIFGSFERFIGILVEHFGGAFPTWLAPIQVAVLPISEKHAEYAAKIMAECEVRGIRAQLMDQDSINYRIRNAETQKIPTMLVAGDREAQAGTVAVRRYGVKEQKVEVLDDVLAAVVQKIKARTLDVSVKDFAKFLRGQASVTTENEAY